MTVCCEDKRRTSGLAVPVSGGSPPGSATLSSQHLVWSLIQCSAMESLLEGMADFALMQISKCLPEDLAQSLQNCWLPKCCVKSLVKFLLKNTLSFILGGLAPLRHYLTADKSFRDILCASRKEKMFTPPSVVVVV